MNQELSDFKRRAALDRLYLFDAAVLKPLSFQDAEVHRIADRVIDILYNRQRFGGNAIKHGSITRGTNLRKPGLSDIDILCYINDDFYRRPIRGLRDFNRVRGEASYWIADHLLDSFRGEFYNSELIEHFEGLCAKFQVKKSRGDEFWSHIDIIFAFESFDDDETSREFFEMSLSGALINTNTMSELRNYYVEVQFKECGDLKVLVRLLKYLNKEGVKHSSRFNAYSD